jgi:ribonuclease HI
LNELTGSAITEQILMKVAFRRERSLAKKLVDSENYSGYCALLTILSASADGCSVMQLVDKRLDALSRHSERRVERLQSACKKFQDKLSAREVIGTSNEPLWRAWFDGSALPNPGKIGIGGVLIGPEGQEMVISCPMGHGDNTVAEYRALIALLQLARTTDVKNLIIYGDSKVVIDDISGETPIRIASIHVMRDQSRALLAGFLAYDLVWISRTRNTRADSLARCAR